MQALWSRSRRRGGFIVSPLYDAIFFIGAPALALVIGVTMADTAIATEEIGLLGRHEAPSDFFIGSFIMAHLGLVLFRSHGNLEIFRQHRVRFTVVPVVLFAAILWSTPALVVVTVVATWWDVYHSSLQTFGLGRIYDRRAGNPVSAGRRLDIGLNLLLYAGPILGGATLMDHLGGFEDFSDLGWMLLASVPTRASEHRAVITWLVLGLGAGYLVVYLAAYYGLARRGYRVSAQKAVLLALTGACSLYAWGFNSFGEAFFVMNFFHALQYFALVWWSEQGNLQRIFGVSDHRHGRWLALGMFLATGLCYGVFAHCVDAGNRELICLTLTVSILHFWYDGFIWSVRRRQV